MLVFFLCSEALALSLFNLFFIPSLRFYLSLFFVCALILVKKNCSLFIYWILEFFWFPANSMNRVLHPFNFIEMAFTHSHHQFVSERTGRENKTTQKTTIHFWKPNSFSSVVFEHFQHIPFAQFSASILLNWLNVWEFIMKSIFRSFFRCCRFCCWNN